MRLGRNAQNPSGKKNLMEDILSLRCLQMKSYLTDIVENETWDLAKSISLDEVFQEGGDKGSRAAVELRPLVGKPGR